MSRDERKLVAAVHKASGDLLTATDFAQTYMARVELGNALGDLWEFSAKAALRAREAVSPQSERSS